MSKPRYGWWSYAKYMVRVYPERKKELRELKSVKITRDLSAAMSGGSRQTSTTENAALRQLPPSKQSEYDAVSKAIERTKLSKTGTERLAIIDMVFWKKSHSLQGAALVANISYDTAIDYHGDFLRLVGFYRGLCESSDA